MNQDFQIRHESKHYRPCNQYKHRFHYSHHRSLLGGRSVNRMGEGGGGQHSDHIKNYLPTSKSQLL